jgi:hypothetical protein
VKSPVPWLIALALVIHIAVWTVWFTLAGRHPVQEVPVVTAPARAGR